MKITKPYSYFITGAYMIFVAYMSLIRLEAPGHHSSPPKQLFLNLLHIPGYALLTFLWINCLKDTDKRTLYLSAAISISYGAFMEYCQTFTGYRTFGWDDIARNALGALIVVAVYQIRKRVLA
ncbi:MAG: VanZ family protein [Candidatus Omnitrophica bacterium]|nr:VanZ family protein [Candidatus Omnitrophota bacterium]